MPPAAGAAAKISLVPALFTAASVSGHAKRVCSCVRFYRFSSEPFDFDFFVLLDKYQYKLNVNDFLDEFIKPKLDEFLKEKVSNLNIKKTRKKKNGF